MRGEPDEFGELLAHQPRQVAELARGLCAEVAREFPDVTTRYYPGWQGLRWKHPAGGLLGTLFARDEDVVVYLEHGAELPDPLALLEGADRPRRTRTLTFRPGDLELHTVRLVEYLDLALEHALASRARRRLRARG